ncbi:NifB/NifX family molybdenum-iron cluster-binding protein [Chloroflexota bacterium]
MKIAVSVMTPTLDTNIDPRFGRCQHILIIDAETMQFEVIENSNTAASGGAGVSTAQMISGTGVDAVLTGNCGPNAYQVLETAGIKVITGVSGTAKDVIEDYKSGKYQPSSQPNTNAKSGVNTGGGIGIGRGRGRGTGRGRGMGRSRGTNI